MLWVLKRTVSSSLRNFLKFNNHILFILSYLLTELARLSLGPHMGDRVVKMKQTKKSTSIIL